MRSALFRAKTASAAVLGPANAYPLTLGIDGAPTVRARSVRGVSRTVDHADSGSTGEGSVSRYRPSQPVPCGVRGSPVDQISVPSKCDRLEFGYPVR